jgi:hypothetical protein
MLTIRQEQLDEFEGVAEAAFERRVAAYVRGQHGDEVVTLASGAGELKGLDEETLLRLVRGGIARARSYGMTWESSVTAFVVLMFTVAPNFDSHPLVRRALRGGGVEPDLRIEEMWDKVSAENWEAARDSYDPAAWEPAGEGGL